MTQLLYDLIMTLYAFMGAMSAYAVIQGWR